MEGKVQLIGTGASTGVPVIGCRCSVCTSNNAKNKRLRTGASITIGSRRFLIDVTPDFRQQALRYALPIPDALFITHTHYDHVGGLEELRAYTINEQRSIPCYLSSSSFESIQKLYYYHFAPAGNEESVRSECIFTSLEGDHGVISIQGVPVQYFSYYQGSMPVTGFRIGTFAYVTDIKQFDSSIFAHLKDIDLLVISALRYSHSRMQMNVEEALSFQKQVGAKRTVLIHLSHELEYEALSFSLPSGVEVAYDGLCCSFSAS